MPEYKDEVKDISIVEVLWKDHVIYANPSWRSVEDKLEAATVKTVGYVVRDNGDSLDLVETLDTNEPISGNHRVILKSCILDIKVLNGA